VRAAAAVLAALALAGCGQAASGGAPAPVATATPASASRFVAPTGSDTGSCTREAPCRSFGRAYRAAAPGEIVDVAAGAYPEQTIPAVPGRTGAPVELRAAAKADVRVAGVTVAGDHVALRGLTVGDVGVDGGGRTVADVRLAEIEGRRLWINDVRGLTVSGGSFGGVVDETPVKVGSDPSSHDVTFDGVLFHDARLESPGAHLECVLALDVQGLVVRDSRFRGCGVFGLLVGHLYGTSPRDVLIEGNVFEPTHQASGEPAPYSMMVGDLLGPARGFVFRGNTFMAEPALLPKRFVGSEMVDNVGAGIGCVPGMAYRDNVWTRQACGATDVVDSGALRQPDASPE
jgi:hypothetical protein